MRKPNSNKTTRNGWIATSLMVERYLRELHAACSTQSPTGRQCEALEFGLVGIKPTLKNTAEKRLQRLVEIGEHLPQLTVLEWRALWVYHFGVGSRQFTWGEGGEITDQWITGVDHKQAAKLIGFKGKRAPTRAKNTYLKALEKIQQFSLS